MLGQSLYLSVEHNPGDNHANKRPPLPPNLRLSRDGVGMPGLSTHSTPTSTYLIALLLKGTFTLFSVTGWPRYLKVGSWEGKMKRNEVFGSHCDLLPFSDVKSTAGMVLSDMLMGSNSISL